MPRGGGADRNRLHRERGQNAAPKGLCFGPTVAKFAQIALVVATGGLSVPKMGATSFGYEIAKQFGHKIEPTRAGLVPFTFDATDLVRYRDLSGVSVPVEVACRHQSFSNAMLFTHRGISGPAILQISSYWNAGEPLTLNFLPLTNASEWLRARRGPRADAELKTVLGEFLPKRLAQRLCEIQIPSRPLRQYAPRDLQEVCEQLQRWTIRAGEHRRLP